MRKGSKIYSVLTGKCPRCHEDHMYECRNPYIPSKLFKMHKKCANCNLKYKIEPSFFYGAMYVSYGLGVAFAIAAFIISNVFIGLNLKEAFVAIVITLIVFMPIISRLSRNIWINFFISYKPNQVHKQLS